MFTFTKRTVLDNCGLRQNIKKSILLGIMTTLCLEGMLPHQAKDIVNNINHNINAFTAQIKTDIDKKEAENTVFLVRKLENPDKQQMVIIGSGVVIANSGDAENPYNRILTVNHIASISRPVKLNYPKAKWNDSIEVYNSYGVHVATAQLSITNYDNKNINLNDSLNEDIGKDIATLKVTPLNNDYSLMSGMELASNPSQSIFPIQSRGNIGFSPGCSGGPVFTEDGKVLGVMSFGTTPFIKDEKQVPLTTYEPMNSYIEQNHWMTMSSLNSDAISQEINSNFKEDNIPKKNLVWVVPVSTSHDIQKDLNKAIPKDFSPKETPGEKVQYLGYPSNVAVLSKAEIMDIHDKIYSEYNVNGNVSKAQLQMTLLELSEKTHTYYENKLKAVQKTSMEKS